LSGWDVEGLPKLTSQQARNREGIDENMAGKVPYIEGVVGIRSGKADDAFDRN
jgi:hypothetical protein